MQAKFQAIAKLKLKWVMFALQTACGIVVSFVLTTSVVNPSQAQVPSIPGLRLPTPEQVANSLDADTQVDTAWIMLDGRRLFQIADTRESLPKRVEQIQRQLRNISQDYFQSNSSTLQVDVRQVALDKKPNVTYPVINITTENLKDQSLLSVTELDAKLQGESDPSKLAQRLSETLEQELRRAKQERQLQFLQRQAAIAGGIFVVMVVASLLFQRWQRRAHLQSLPTSTGSGDPVTTQLNQQQRRNMQEVRQRLFQLSQSIVWGGGALAILGLFPYTRIAQYWILTVLQVPFGLGVVALVTYVGIRFSYVLIDRFTSALAYNTLLAPDDSLRLQLRVSTVSGVTKSITTLSGIAIALLVGLSILGVNIAPILAGAGLIGVAISLASQSLIKDAINGFFIIFEDQYAVGDVIAVGEEGKIGGMVENMNLRITQLRDAEGRLITVPNSEIQTVANLSSRWSRADLNIPVAYHTDIDQALQLIKSVAADMDQDPKWQEPILEAPQVLGIDSFGDRGLIVRVWIKTQPLKQWDVAREFRRRLKITFDKAGLGIPVPQQAIWFNNPQLLSSQFDGREKKDSNSN